MAGSKEDPIEFITNLCDCLFTLCQCNGLSLQLSFYYKERGTFIKKKNNDKNYEINTITTTNHFTKAALWK